MSGMVGSADGLGRLHALSDDMIGKQIAMTEDCLHGNGKTESWSSLKTCDNYSYYDHMTRDGTHHRAWKGRTGIQEVLSDEQELH